MSYNLSTTSYPQNRLEVGQFVITLIVGSAMGILLLSVLDLEAKWMIFAAAGISVPFLASLSGDFKQFITGLLLFSIPLNADIHFLYTPDAGGVHGFIVGMPDICLLVLLVLWGLEIILGVSINKVNFFPRVTVPYFCVIAVSALSAIQAANPLLSLFDIWQMIKVYFLFFYLANNVRDKRDITFVLSMLAVGVALQALIVLLQFTTGTTLGILGQQTSSELFRPQMDISYVRRPGGTVGHANTLGRYFVLLLPVGISMFLFGKKKLLFGITTAVGLLGMIFTLSRSAWIGLIFAMCIILVLFWRKQLHRIFTPRNVLLGVLALCVVAVTMGPMIYERFVSPDFGATMSRLTTSKVALRVIRDNPILGVGINNYIEILDSYYDPQDPFTRVAPVHNLYLLFASEIGLIGLTAFLWLMYIVFRELRRAVSRRDAFLSSVGIGLYAGFLALLLMAFSDYVYKHSPPLMTTLWVMAAVAFAVTSYTDKKVPTAPIIGPEKSNKPEQISNKLLKLNSSTF